MVRKGKWSLLTYTTSRFCWFAIGTGACIFFVTHLGERDFSCWPAGLLARTDCQNHSGHSYLREGLPQEGQPRAARALMMSAGPVSTWRTKRKVHR